MFTIKQTPDFAVWLSGIKDNLTRRRLARRLEKASLGNLGDVQPVGGGDKSTQQAEIAKAIALASILED